MSGISKSDPQQERTPRRPLLIAVAVMVAAIAAFAIADFGGLFGDPPVRIGGTFTLTDHTGKRVSDADYKDKVKLVFFGFTNCPDICPSALDRMSTALDKLGPKADGVVGLFISFDTERDTIKVLADYVSNFHKGIVGLTGSKEEIDAVAREYRIYFARVDDKNSTSGYSFDHTALVYLMDRDGRYLGHFVPTDGPDQIVKKIAPLL